MADKRFGVRELIVLGSGTPTITSPGDLNINSDTLGISTNITIGGKIGLVGTGVSYGGLNQVLTSNGPNAAPTWQNASGGSGGSSDPVGTIVAWAGSVATIPSEYQLCDGGAASTSALQAITGTNVPDLRDRFIVGANNVSGTGTYPGVGVGSTGGAATHTLTVGEMPSHNHPFPQNSNGTYDYYWIGKSDVATDFSWSTGPNYELSTSSGVASQGGGQAHNNLPPYYALCYIIKHTATSGGGGSGTGTTKIAVLSEEQSSGTDGGGFTNNAWRDRTLNTEIDQQSFVTFSSSNNYFTLDSGTYKINWSAPAHAVDRHQSKLLYADNASFTSSSEKLGSSEACYDPITEGNSLVQTRSFGETVITITKTTYFKIQHRCTDTKSTTGFGVASNFGVDEVYTQVVIQDLNSGGGSGGGTGTLTDVDVKQYSDSNTPRTEYGCSNPIEVTVTAGIATIGIGSTSNAYGKKYIQTTEPTTDVCDGDIWYDTTPGSGSGGGVDIQDNDSLVGTATTINFGANISVSPISAGIVTVTGGSGSSGDFVTGMIMMFSGTSIPTGFLLCNGSNGTPDLRGKFIVGAQSASKTGTTSQAGPNFNTSNGSLASNYDPGDIGGSTAHKLTEAQLASHDHSMSAHTHNIGNHTHSSGNYATSGGSHSHNTPTGITSGDSIYEFAQDGENGSNTGSGTGGTGNHNHGFGGSSGNPNSTNAVTGNMNTSPSTGNAGSGTYHENRPPYYALCYIMKT